MACLGPGEAVSPRAADPIAGLDGAIQSDARSEAAAKSHALDIATVASRLEVETEHGLAQSEAAARLRRFGPNALREAPRPGLVALVWEQLDDFLIWLLLAAAAIAATVGYFAGEGFVESIAIIAIVVLNATLGVVQERRAENAMRALDALVAHDIVVLREGERLSVPSAELVPGDIVMLETGNLVPADLRLLESANLRIDEAALTGESVSVRMSAESVAPPQAEAGGMRGEGLGEGARVVVHGADGIRDEMRHRLGILAVVQEVRGDAGRSGDQQPAQIDPVAVLERALMESDVGTSRLAAHRQGELVAIRWQVPELAEGRCGAVGDDPLLSAAFPCGCLGSKLQPGRAQFDVAGDGRAREAVHAMGHPLEDRAVLDQPREGGGRDAGEHLGLSACYEPPLFLGEAAEAVKRCRPSHSCILARNR